MTTVAGYIMADAKRRGLDHVFGIPGSGSPMDLMEGGRVHGVEFICTAHESTAAISAAYYGAMKGTPGIAICIKGVGAGNLVGGAVNVFFERKGGLVCISEQRPIAAPVELVTQMLPVKSHSALLTPVLAFAGEIRAETLSATLNDAVKAASGLVSDAPGVAFLDLPSCQSGLKLDPAAAHETAIIESVYTSGTAADAQIKALADFVNASKRLVIIAGAHVDLSDAVGALADFVELTGAGVLTTMEARGVYDERNPRWQGVFVARGSAHTAEGILIETADAVLVVGTDTLQREGTFNGTAHLAGKPLCEVCVQQDFQTLSSDHTLRVDGDLSGLLVGASKLVTARAGFAIPELEAYRAKVRELYFPRPKVTFALHDILEVSRRLLPDDGVAFGETGIAVIFLETLWPVYSPNTFFGTAGGRTMGLTIPAILGAKLARPDLPMIGFCGDGSTLMRLGELELFSRLNIAVPLVIINDQALGTMMSRQKARGLAESQVSIVGSNSAATISTLAFHPISFETIATGLGLLGATVHTPAEFESALEAALAADRCTIIDARIDAKAFQDSFGPTIGKGPATV